MLYKPSDRAFGYTVAIIHFDVMAAGELERPAHMLRASYSGFLGVHGDIVFFQDAWGTTWWHRWPHDRKQNHD